MEGLDSLKVVTMDLEFFLFSLLILIYFFFLKRNSNFIYIII
jgi:hypothetical protein